MARRLYCLFFYLITPLILLRLLYRASKSRAYARRITERFGFFNKPAFTREKDFHGALWIHAVSMGETIAAAPLIKRLQQQAPDMPVVVTTMTPTGSARVNALLGDSVFHVYAPYDLPGSVKRFLQRTQPRVLIIMETELWPNTVYYCRQSNIPVVLANARLSAKSAAGYQRFSCLTRPMLQNLSMVVAQHQSDAQRFLELGLPAQRVNVSGSIKFDLQLDEQLTSKAVQLKALWSEQGKRLVLIGASTHEGEEEQLLYAFQQLLVHYPSALLILVPRHPERFDKVALLCEQRQLRTVRRSEAEEPCSHTQVVIGDTMGELLLFYGCADIAFVGGSLIEHGGHNVLEPAAWGVPVVTGDSDFNFSEISRLLQQAGGMKKVHDTKELTQLLLRLATDDTLRITMGRKALSVVESNRGALERLLVQLNRFF